MKPPPPGLTPHEFARRRDLLIAQGKPLTIENVDPDLWAWALERRRIADRQFRLAIASLLAVSLAAVALIVIHLTKSNTQ